MSVAVAVTEAGVLQTLASGLQIALGGAFFLSVIPKLRRPRTFARTVARYELLPTGLAAPAALAVTGAELVVATSLLSGRVLALGVALALVLLALFAVATATNLRRGRDIECGCFGSSSETISPRSLARIGAFAAGAVALAAVTAGAEAESLLAPWSEQPWADAAFLVSAAGVAAGLAIATVWALEAPKLAALARIGLQPPPYDHAVHAAASAPDELRLELRGYDR